MKKNLLMVILTLIMTFSFATQGMAVNVNEVDRPKVQITENEIITFDEYSSDLENTTNVKLDMLNINVPYNAKDIEVEYVRNTNSITAIILDKETKTKLESCTEHFDELETLRNAEITPMSTFWRTMDVEKYVSPGSVRIIARVGIWSEGSFRQIRKVDYVDQLEGGAGPYTLESTRTSLNNSVPTARLSVNAVGNVSVYKSHSTTGEFSFESLKGVGFSMSGTVNQDWYARKYYNFDVVFDLY